MSVKKQLLGLLFSISLFAPLLLAIPSHAESVLAKIERTGQLTAGVREDVPPFAFYDKSSNWVGFSVDMAQRLGDELGKKFNKPIQVVKKPVNSKTRIPLVVNGEIDIEIGTTTITLAREETIDFSLPFFITGAKFIVHKESGIKNVGDLAGKRVGVAQGTHHAKNLEIAMSKGLIKSKCEVVQFEDHAKGFLGLTQGKVDAYFTDESQLFGQKKKAPNPGDWVIVGPFLSYEPYGFILPQNDSPWRDFVNTFLVRMIKSGEFYRLYDKWMGPNSEVPMPMSEDYQYYLKVIAFPD
jgi:polar amino acid transport system substrate-binding protein/glutamate/aspartate transport system substrate-binding protein